MSVRSPSTYTGPGLVDLQVNGYAGFDFNSDPATWTAPAWRAAAGAMRLRGVVAALPTFITDHPDRLLLRAAAYAGLLETDPELAAFFPALHIEGPFISPEDGPRGAHNRAFCTTPNQAPDLLDRLQDQSGGRVKLLTLAPEVDGALPLIERATAAGVVVALGHTAAGSSVLAAAVDAGARLSTHLGNGSHQMLPRLDNYVQRQLADDRLLASFIADGHHIPFPTLQNFIRAKGPSRSILVTDAIAAADCGPGTYLLGGEEVEVTPDLRCAKPGQPNLSGSALTLDRAVLHVHRHCGVPFDEAWAMASSRPAALVGLGEPVAVTVRVRGESLERLVV